MELRMNIISGKTQGFTIIRSEKAAGCTGRPKLSGKTIITTGTAVSHEDLKASAVLTTQHRELDQTPWDTTQKRRLQI